MTCRLLNVLARTVFCCAVVLAVMPARASAQEEVVPVPAACAEGRERGPEGRCCWPGQHFSVAHGQCEGLATCPTGTVEHGDDCVAPLPAVLTAPLPVPPSGSDTRRSGPVIPGATVVPLAPAVDASRWALLIDVADPSTLRRPTQATGADELLIGMAVALFDVGWTMSLLVPILDELSASCRDVSVGWPGTPRSCQSWPLAFAPVVGGLVSGLTSFGTSRPSAGWGVSLGSAGLVLQVVGIIAIGVALGNRTTEFSFTPIEDGDLSVELSFDAPGSDAGGSMVLRF